MIIPTIICVVLIITQMVFIPQIENVYWCGILMFLSQLTYVIVLGIAYNAECKLKSRIKALEDKLNDKEGKQ